MNPPCWIPLYQSLEKTLKKQVVFKDFEFIIWGQSLLIVFFFLKETNKQTYKFNSSLLFTASNQNIAQPDLGCCQQPASGTSALVNYKWDLQKFSNLWKKWAKDREDIHF